MAQPFQAHRSNIKTVTLAELPVTGLVLTMSLKGSFGAVLDKTKTITQLFNSYWQIKKFNFCPATIFQIMTWESVWEQHLPFPMLLSLRVIHTSVCMSRFFTADKSKGKCAVAKRVHLCAALVTQKYSLKCFVQFNHTRKYVSNFFFFLSFFIQFLWKCMFGLCETEDGNGKQLSTWAVCCSLHWVSVATVWEKGVCFTVDWLLCVCDWQTDGSVMQLAVVCNLQRQGYFSIVELKR